MLLSARASGKGLHWGPAAIGGFFIFVAVSGAVFVAVAERGLTPSLRNWLLPEARSGREVTSMFSGVISHDFQQKEEPVQPVSPAGGATAATGLANPEGLVERAGGERAGGVPGGGANPRGRTE
ncbi:MAG: hypothetical protein MZV65_41435 [Chromatiales bacterium]|nr:hypothetical protein [Chromatiales bacterium]